MLLFKACARCRGDMVYQEDHWGPYMNCLQCGHYIYLTKPKREEGSRKHEQVLQAVLL